MLKTKSKSKIKDPKYTKASFYKDLYSIYQSFVSKGLHNESYKTTIQILALKAFDERASKLDKNRPLKFRISPEEENIVTYEDLSSPENVFAKQFADRIHDLYNKAKNSNIEIYRSLLEITDIDFENPQYIEAIMSIVKAFQKYTTQDLQQTDIHQLIFYNLNETSREWFGQYITPIWVADFMAKIINPKQHESVIDPCVGTADFLVASFLNGKTTNLYGMDIDRKILMAAKLNMIINGIDSPKLYATTRGSIQYKINDKDKAVSLNYYDHKNGNWDNWPDGTKLKKFDIVLTNPPFGASQKYKADDSESRQIAECYELWHLNKQKDWIDPGILFLENAVRILKENGRMGIIVSRSIANGDKWRKAREWLINNMRIVAIFDFPENTFAETGIPTTAIIAYKPPKEELKKLQEQNYKVFMGVIEKTGFRPRTIKGIRHYDPILKISEETFEIETNKTISLFLMRLHTNNPKI
jgi:Type I restriction-modification system methyltransferase subunit